MSHLRYTDLPIWTHEMWFSHGNILRLMHIVYLPHPLHIVSTHWFLLISKFSKIMYHPVLLLWQNIQGNQLKKKDLLWITDAKVLICSCLAFIWAYIRANTSWKEYVGEDIIYLIASRDKGERHRKGIKSQYLFSGHALNDLIPFH